MQAQAVDAEAFVDVDKDGDLNMFLGTSGVGRLGRMAEVVGDGGRVRARATSPGRGARPTAAAPIAASPTPRRM